MARPRKPRFRVLIWQPALRRYVPAKGVRPAPHTQFGLRKALRQLAAMGLGGDHLGRDYAVLVERIDEEREGRRRGVQAMAAREE